ncbi:MAG TPA: hypothetical protein LFV66_06180 [Rickettsia endosymbiont of Bembidion lapponicum]|nr:hypothetical protein [Rickettsia endosymbiont of Bembidion lapponicum]
MNIKNKNDPLSSIRKDIKNIVSLPVQNNQFARYLVDYLKGNPPQKQSMAPSS